MRFGVLVYLLLLALLAPAPDAVAREEILSFHSHIEVLADGALDVTETIRVRAEGRDIRRGIFREFPTRYEGRYGEKVRTTFDVLEVSLDGGPVNWATERLSNGTRVRIGDANVLLRPGEYAYTVHYRTERQLYFGKPERDELYFNVTGQGWAFPILAASVTVRLPGEASILERIAYTGTQGEQGSDYAVTDSGPGRIEFRTTRALGVHEGLTIAVAWPAGFVARPSESEELGYLLGDNLQLLAAGVGFVIVFIYYLVAWFRAGRDPDGGAVIARYAPPPGLSPAATRYVSEMDYDDTAFTAAIVNMAVKGYYTIDEAADGDMTIRRDDAEGPWGGDRAALTPGERALDNRLFSGNPASVAIKQKNHATLRNAQDALKSVLKREYADAHFVRNYDLVGGGIFLALVSLVAVAWLADEPVIAGFIMVWLGGWTTGVLAFAVNIKKLWARALSARGGLETAAHGISAVFSTLFFLPFLGGTLVGAGFLASQISIPVAALVAATLITCVVFYYLLKAPTRLGAKVIAEIDGFKEYLSVAEKDRMNFANPPERTPELFEKFLPYAIALGVEHQWGEQFDGILTAASTDPDADDGGYRPRWYRSSRGYGGFRASSFSSSLGSSFAGTVAAASTAPSKGGSGGGFGGGGGAGGGGGGGGGGGW